MDAKQILTAVCSAVTLSLVASTGAFASSGVTNKVFVSGPLIMFFLGFCALVVVIQCVPAMISLYGMLKGVVSVTKVDKAAIKKY